MYLICYIYNKDISDKCYLEYPYYLFAFKNLRKKIA